MLKAYYLVRNGKASSAFELREVEIAEPKENEVQIQIQAIGLNRAEKMYREGAYVIDPVFPATLGYEGAGVVVAIGEGVNEVAIGDKVEIRPMMYLALSYDHRLIDGHIGAAFVQQVRAYLEDPALLMAELA